MILLNLFVFLWITICFILLLMLMVLYWFNLGNNVFVLNLLKVICAFFFVAQWVILAIAIFTGAFKVVGV